MSKFNELVTKLREIFQIDRPELDFGIYRILNARSEQINDYLENRLAAKVKAALSDGNAATAQQLQSELQEAEKSAQALGVSPDAVPRVLELREKLARYGAGASEQENAVFSHLLAFFSRYYDNGDFISQRRYKGDTYAIPYAGEEVMLHWANKDQYYTKSGENFANYSFKLEDGRSVHCRLVAADTAKDNRKDNDKERRFVLIDPQVVTRVDEQGDDYEEELLPVVEAESQQGQELILHFEYRAMPKGSKQAALVEQAVERILADAAVKSRWLELGKRVPTEKNPQRTLLEKHLSDYTTKNTADYFIHKDLGGFLRRELDFYIKNEVMHLDDVQNAGAFADIEKNLRMIQCLRSIALELITFLAQLEDFQKKLWLKKKFVVSSHYCITLDRVPEALWPEVVANEQQWARWKQLGVWDVDAPGTVEDLKAAPYRMVDTSLFSAEFKASLLKQVPDLDKTVDGLLIHSDNFHALNILQTRYTGEAKCIYIDPPYNTGSDGFAYKDRYSHSSWLALMSDRLHLANPLLAEGGFFQCSISDIELYRGKLLLDSVFGEESLKTIAIKMSTASGVKMASALLAGGVPKLKEYLLVAAKGAFKGYFIPKIDKEKWDDEYRWFIEGVSAEELEILRSGIDDPDISVETLNDIAKKIDIKNANAVADQHSIPVADREDWKFKNADRIVQIVAVTPGLRDLVAKESQGHDRPFLVVTTTKGNRYLVKRCDADAASRPRLQVSFASSNLQTHPGDFWQDISTTGLDNEGGVDFKNGKKPIKLISRMLEAARTEGSMVVDYFAGSGTTIEAVINRWQVEAKRTKLIACEADHQTFNTKTLARLQNAIASANASSIFKVLKLEGYEDTLNNLQLRRTSAQGDLLNTLPQQAKDDYLLNYLLDVESRGSLLSVEDFKKPFDYTLNVAVDSAGAFEPRKIDLVETFNYLIGLRVKHIDAQPQRGFVTVTGTLPSNETCLVLWRDCDVLDYEGISELCDKLAINPADNEFDVVYINGDHNIPTVLTQTAEEGGATRVLKLRQIEPEFLERMFSVEDV